MTNGTAEEAARSAASMGSRRRFIKLGASTVPVGLSLASRPVMAWRCNTTSAWGSAQMMPNQSTTARNAASSRIDESWTIQNWLQNTTRAGLGFPWVALGRTTSTSMLQIDSATGNVTDAGVASYTIGQLFGSGGYPSGLTSGNKVWKKIKNGTEMQKYLIVARLNAKLLSSVQACLNSNGVDQLAGMLGGSYQPPNAGAPIWYWPDIKRYLESNYIVVAQ